MKRLQGLMILLILLFSTQAGCARQEETVATVSRETEGPSIKAAATVDEFLAAIGSDTEIVLEPGTYDLSTASDYGREPANPAYSWRAVYDGYELVLKGVQNLTVSGSGNDMTTLTALSRYANVLTLRNCTGVTMQDFTAGHVEEVPGECSGGVVLLEGSMGIALERMGLYGCGVNGLRADLCSQITLGDCDIYDCSNSALILDRSDDVTVENCRMYDLGDAQYGGGSVISSSDCRNVTVNGCEIRDNVVQYLLTACPSDTVTLKNNTFTGNRVRSSAFSLWQTGLTLDGNTFDGNSIRCWYDAEGTTALDSTGQPMPEAMLEQLYPQNARQTAERPEQTEIHVSTVDEFIAAIGPNTRILLDAALYDFSTATGYGTSASQYHTWENIFDGPGLVITGVDNMTICASDANAKGHTLSAVPRYANVLTFSGCTGITLEGFTAGHTEEPGYCTGGVLCFRDCDDMLVDNCRLYGCGTLGVSAEYSGNITVRNSEIYECSYGGIQMWNVDGAVIENCTFRDLGGSSLSFSDCRDVVVDGEAVSGYYTSDY